ncbi:MAG: Heat shock protein DnaJ [Candidatus Tokpelaia sp. JSC188]|nr:MAG: Heat shock protein DnaJ [Candidatus Tokpelaia sp. JSC188]
MSIDSKYFDSIRIRSGKKTRSESDIPRCQWKGCIRSGTHRGPVGRNREGEYLYFCITHIREYNKNFNYFSDFSDGEILKFQQDAITGHRPTWKTFSENTTRASQHFSHLRSGSASYRSRLRYSFNLLNEQEPARPRQRKFKTLEIKAFATLGLEEGASSSKIKEKYKALVKLHHPDSNGGDRSSEGRFREVLQAYNLLKQAGFC